MEKIWACEENFLVSYLSKRENITPELLAKIESGDWIEFKASDSKIISIDGDTATIRIAGPLSRTGPDFIDMLFGIGGTSYEDIKDAAAKLEDMDEVKTVVLQMDTPGGEVAGVDSTYDSIKALAAKKTVIARNNGMIASGGVWLACAAKRIEAVDPLCWTGSIGVVITAIDRSKMFEKNGIARVKIVSRNAPNKHLSPTTESGQASLQNQADAVERHFLNRVAEGRGVSVDYVIENFGNGDIMIAQDPDKDKPDAISVGLIDGMAPGPHQFMEISAEQQERDDAALASAHFEGLGLVAWGDNKISVETPAVAGQTPIPSPHGDAGTKDGENMEVQHMDLNKAMAEHPAIKAEVDQMTAKARQAGVEEGKALVQARIEKVAPIMASDDYDSVMKAQCSKALKGEISLEAFESVVSMEDMRLEREKSDSAAKDTDELPDTPAQAGHGAGVSEDGMINCEADMIALAEGAK